MDAIPASSRAHTIERTMPRDLDGRAVDPGQAPGLIGAFRPGQQLRVVVSQLGTEVPGLGRQGKHPVQEAPPHRRFLQAGAQARRDFLLAEPDGEPGLYLVSAEAL